MTPLRTTLVLCDDDVRAVLALDACVELQRQAFMATTVPQAGRVPRSTLEAPSVGSTLGAMMAIAPDGTTAACKVLTSAPANRERGLPRSLSTIVLLDLPTGFPIALLAGTYLTNVRTAATAVLAIETLGHPGARELGLLGAGPIGALILDVLAARGGAWRVAVHAPTAAHREALAARFDAHERLRVRPVADPRLAVAADVVVCATDGRAEAFDASWLPRAGVVVSIASRRHVAELPAAALRGARVVVDDRDAACEEAAEFVGMPADTLVTLGEVLTYGVQTAGDVTTGRVVFKSTGLALQDVVTASAVYRLAVDAEVGQRVALAGGRSWLFGVGGGVS